jgi:hypothetical protein
VIALAITLAGNSSFDNSGCSQGMNQTKSQYVKLVQ